MTDHATLADSSHYSALSQILHQNGFLHPTLPASASPPVIDDRYIGSFFSIGALCRWAYDLGELGALEPWDADDLAPISRLRRVTFGQVQALASALASYLEFAVLEQHCTPYVSASSRGPSLHDLGFDLDPATNLDPALWNAGASAVLDGVATPSPPDGMHGRQPLTSSALTAGSATGNLGSPFSPSLAGLGGQEPEASQPQPAASSTTASGSVAPQLGSRPPLAAEGEEFLGSTAARALFWQQHPEVTKTVITSASKQTLCDWVQLLCGVKPPQAFKLPQVKIIVRQQLDRHLQEQQDQAASSAVSPILRSASQQVADR